MERRTLGWLLKIPAVIVLIASFFGGIYAAINGIQGIGVSTPIFIGIIIILYAVGEYLQKKEGFY